MGGQTRGVSEKQHETFEGDASLNEVQQQQLILCDLAHEVAQRDLVLKYKKMSIAHIIRQASDLQSSQSLDVYNSTSSMLQHCRRWSDRAIDLYTQINRTLTEQRGGKPPSHRQCTQWRDSRGKRPFLVEHEYPLQIIRHHILEDQFHTTDIFNWIQQYGAATVILHEEDPPLITCVREHEAKDRYKHIRTRTHPHFSPKDD